MSEGEYTGFRVCGPQETKSFYTGKYVEQGDNQQLLGLTTSDGLIPLGGFPKELRGTVPSHFVATLRPILASFSYCALTGPAHQVEVSLVGRKLGNVPPALAALPEQWRHTICIHPLDPLALVKNVFMFNIPVPVDTEAGNGNPFSIRIRTIGKQGISMATVNYQWGFLDLGQRVHVGTGA